MPSGLFHGLVAAVITLAVLKSALPERIKGARGVDSRYNWLLDGVEIAVCLLMLVLCAALPVLTGFAGFWPLAAVACSLHAAALAVRQREFLPLWAMGEWTGAGRRSAARTSIRQSRWPFEAAFRIGNITGVLYVISIAPAPG